MGSMLTHCSKLFAVISSADPGFLPGEGAKGLMTLYGMGMSDYWYTQTHICNFSRCFFAILCLNGVEQLLKEHQSPFFLPLRRRNPRLRRRSLRRRGGRRTQRPPSLDPRLNIVFTDRYSRCEYLQTKQSWQLCISKQTHSSAIYGIQAA